MGVHIKEITYEECDKLIDKNTIIVLPIGGGSKEHGNHLPMGTDYYVTDWVADRVTERCNVVTLPTLPYAYFPAFRDWKGSVTIEANNFTNYVKDIIASFARFGVKKFLIIDGGVSTHLPLMVLAGTLSNDLNIKVAVTNILGLGKEVETKVCKQPRGGHGDEAETSTMLVIREDLVHMDKTTEEYSPITKGCNKNGYNKVFLPSRMVTPHGTNGNSTLATKEKGEAILNAMVDDIVEFVESYETLEV